MRILFVCTGNTCRSPMAEAVYNNICKTNNIKHSAFSRGLNVFFSEPINVKALKALDLMGITDYEHMSEQISENDVQAADLILVMTSEHKMALKSLFPKYSSKIFTLNEKAYSIDKPVSDPYGQSQEIYNKCLTEITEAIKNLLDKLKS